MKELEKIIKSRREEFDYADPPAGHEERFLEKLNSGNKKSYMFLRIAAVFLAAAFISAASYIFLGLNNEENNMNAFSTEIKETIYYYNTLNHEKESRIMAMPMEDKKEKIRIQDDLKKYEEQYDQLINDLRRFPNDPRVINAIIEYHRSKSEMLEHIIYQLQQTNV